MQCPKCGENHVVKNDVTSTSGKQNYLCKSCKHQFVESPEHYRIPQHKIDLIDRLLLEKIPLAGSLGQFKCQNDGYTILC